MIARWVASRSAGPAWATPWNFGAVWPAAIRRSVSQAMIVVVLGVDHHHGALGGGGGDGGDSGGLIAIGGKGANTSVGGGVQVVNLETITTQGDNARAIFAQSIGGGGGNGGSSGGVLSIGGSGGAGGDGGIVSVANLQDLATEGDNAQAIFAQSVGGGGGNGGYAYSAGLAFTIGVGGDGAEGGDGGLVLVNPTADLNELVASKITTDGIGSTGIFAQSVGGGGGNGGGAVSGSFGVGVLPSVGLSIGGSGGVGGQGSGVVANHRGSIETREDVSAGIFAQSIGGGGGNGGGAVAVAGGALVANVGISLGGSGGDGGNGGTVLVNAFGGISTHGNLSHGIVAQSVGGGGGNGGYSAAASVGTVNGQVAVGGAGGRGGFGGEVFVNTLADNPDDRIRTLGHGSTGVFAQSVGGGGGNGGFAVTAGIGGGNVGVDVGGFGGDGGIAKSVNVVNGLSIATSGVSASGIFAQSVGGGGGNGGGAYSFGLGLAALDVAVGGRAGKGGAGGAVTVTNEGVVMTGDDLSYGVFAQSVGGGGGNGGNAVAASATISPPKVPSASITVGVGGLGGDGGNGGTVRVENAGAVETAGQNTHAVMAQSVGGGGGSGGYATTAVLSVGGASKLEVTIGGTAGRGGNGGNVIVGRDEDDQAIAGTSVTTYGDGANAIHAQSIGGGGGDGGLALSLGLGENFSSQTTSLQLDVTVGGKAKDGGDGGAVDVYSDQALRTFGNDASSIFAQSIGGGGGRGGNAVSALVTFVDNNNATSREIAGVITVGGIGGDGGTGGSVKVENVNTIETGWRVTNAQGDDVLDEDGDPIVTGDGSHGILAQSIGGGGGVGGRANSINLTTGEGQSCKDGCPDAKTDFKLTVAVGGNGGKGGDAGSVMVANDGLIATQGSTASGIFAQSIGGGGGDGGNGTLGTKDLPPEEYGIDFPLISKDKTKQYTDLSVAVGGSGGSSGKGEAVSVVNRGHITTYGSNSDGIFAQSIGGGGGVGGRAAIGATGRLGIGGEGGSAGSGGEVTVENLDGGRIETTGTASFAIFAQSVGGGGGMAGNVDRLLAGGVGPIPDLNLGIGAAFSRDGGSGGNGGNVTVTSGGTLVTHGDASTVIFAQSVGGGGGIVGSLGNELVGGLNSWDTGSAGGIGSSGLVTVEHSGDIVTYGAHATGIFAQSAGGSSVLSLGGKALGARVDLAGSIATYGLGSIAILANSQATVADGNIDITLSGKTGAVIGGESDGTHSGVGVYMVGGDQNTLTTHGLLTTVGGVDAGFAFAAETGNDAVESYGTVTGSFDLSAGVNSFTNHVDAAANFGALANAGAGGTVTNFGWMSPGGAGRVMATTNDGSIVQNAEGTYGVDLDLALTPIGDESDVILAGESIDMAGVVDVTILNAGNALPGEHETFIARSGAGLTDTATQLVTPPSAVAVYSLETDIDDMWLAYGIDFAPDGLNRNQNALGEYINAFQLAGGSEPLEPIVETLFFLPGLESYAAALDRLSPEPYIDTELATVLSGVRFGRSLMECPRAENEDEDRGCVWFRGGGEKLEQSESFEQLGYDEVVFDVQGGLGGSLGENSGAVIGFAYGHSQIDSQDIASSTGHRFHAGVGLNHTNNGATLSVAALGGAALYDVERHMDFLDPAVTAEGDQTLYYGGGQIRLAQSAKLGALRFEPLFEAWGGYFHHGSVSESGAGPVDLDIDSGGDAFAAIRPALTLAAEFTSGDGGMFRPFVTGGFTYFVTGDEVSLTATMQGEENAVPGFTVSGALEEYYIDAAAGFDMQAPSGAALRLEGSAQYAEQYLSYGGNAKLVAPF